MTTATRRPALPAGLALPGRAQVTRVARRRRLLRRASLLALAFVPVLLLAWVVLASPLLSVRTVEVTGADRVSPAAVQAAARVPDGVPLARVDVGAVQSRVLALTAVARVRVVRAWPRTLRLQVTERAAVAVLQQGDGTWTSIDGSGVRFASSTTPPAGLPALQATDPSAARTGLQVLAELPPALVGQVAAVQVPSPFSVVLVLRDGRSVVWGPPGESARKAAIVGALLPRPGKTIDVTSPDVAVVR